MWLIYTLIASVLWAVGQIFIKKGLHNTTPLFNSINASISTILLTASFAFINGVNFDLMWKIAPMTFIAAFLMISFYYVIGRGQLAFTGTVVGMYPVVTVILALLFLHETLNLYQQIAIAVVILGTIFIALPEKGQKFTFGSWFWWALLGVFAIGTSEFLCKLLITQSDVYTFLFTFGFSYLFGTLLIACFDKKGRKLPAMNPQAYLPTIIGVWIMEIGFIVYNIALSLEQASLVTPISGSYVALTAILALIILKEKIDSKHWFGITLAAIGVVLIGIV